MFKPLQSDVCINIGIKYIDTFKTALLSAVKADEKGSVQEEDNTNQFCCSLN